MLENSDLKRTQSTYIVRFRRIHVTVLTVDKQQVLYIKSVSSLSYPACKARTPGCPVWSLRLYHIFPRSLLHGTILGRKFLDIDVF